VRIKEHKKKESESIMTSKSSKITMDSKWLDRMDIDSSTGSSVASREEKAIGKLRMQWQFGDWKSLSSIEISEFINHPNRGEVALLSACAWIQLGNLKYGKTLLLMAREWGCNKKLMITLLVAGAYEKIAEYSQLRGWESKAIECWQKSAEGLGGDVSLLSMAKCANSFHK
jgi:hypothetical protein